MAKRNVWIGILVLILAGFAVYQNFAGAQLTKEEKPKANYLAPSFVLKGFDGKSYTVGGRRDKGLILNFWASWCGPCKEEAPMLQKLYEKYKGRLDIYAVNASALDDVASAREFVKRYRLTFPILSDADGSVSERYWVSGFPTNVYIDKNGVIREIVLGVKPQEEMEASARRIMGD